MNNKELLLKDLCARLPYKVKCHHESYSEVYTLYAIDSEHLVVNMAPNNSEYDNSWWNSIEQIKPYLLPMSSMSEEQKKSCNYADDLDLYLLDVYLEEDHYNKTKIPAVIYHLVDWCNRNHFDYRGLISQGLAIDATNLNIY